MAKKILMIITIVFITIGALCTYGVYRFLNPFGKLIDKESSDSYYYTRDNKGVIYSPMGNWFELGKHQMQVDIHTFQVLARDFAKDKDYGYFKSRAINNSIDIPSFEVKLGYTPVDKNYVYIVNDNYYHINKNHFKALKILEDADAKTFIQINFDFAKDKNFVYQNYNRCDSLDVNSFNVINQRFCKDHKGIYYYSYGNPLHKIEEANIAEVISLTDNYIRDDKNVYFYVGYKSSERFDQVVAIPFKNSKNISFFKDVELIKIDANIYYQSNLIKNVDASSFEELQYGYTKDKNHVFFNGELVEGADANTFRYNDKTYNFTDKNHTYEIGEKVNNKK